MLYFDTLCEVTLFCSQKDIKTAIEATEKIFSNIEDLFSPNSKNLSSPEVIQLFQKAGEINTLSNGFFDISVGSLSRLWGFFSKEYRIPNQEEISQALKFVGMKKIKLSEGKIILPPKTHLDWGGIAKGFGVDKVSQALQKMGIRSGFINAGGDLYCWGTNPNHLFWKIGIKHPRKSGYLGVVSISNSGAATTGDYQRFFIKNGTRYHHILNPKTGFPSNKNQSVTVIGPETMICDALSTAIFVENQLEGLLKSFPEYGAIIVDKSGQLSSQGKSFLLKKASGSQ